MKSEDQIAAVCLLCDWLSPQPPSKLCAWTDDAGQINLSNPLTDMNAVRRMEQLLIPDLRGDYLRYLDLNGCCSPEPVWRIKIASSTECIKAFLQANKVWK